jgi:uncharacterized protein
MFPKLVAVAASAFVLSANNSTAQGTEKPGITVTGMAEKEVVPDEIYLSITLSERYNGPNKATIEMQETQLREMLKKLGVNLADLSLSNVNASYVRINWASTDVVAKKSYSLKLGDAEMVGKVFRGLKDMDVKETYIYKVDFAGREAVKKALRSEAIRDAREKAQDMLLAIGHTAGMPESIVVNEQNPREYYGVNMAYAKTANAGADNDFAEFKKIKFTVTVNAKFEIK